MIGRLRREIAERRFRFDAADILRTPPITRGREDAVVFSQVCRRDFLIYLLAAKSFAQHTGLCRFEILDDGSLTEEHRALLRHHIPGIVVTHISNVSSTSTPKGGAWERLLRMAAIGEGEYVVQLDADVLTFGPVRTVVESIERGLAFTLTSEPDARVVPTSEAAANARRHQSSLLQHAAESRLDFVGPEFATHYIRGCAGFTGLPPLERRALIGAFSRRMTELMGARWCEWGTEQVTVNVLTANSPDLIVLRPPVYSTHEAHPLPVEAELVHFIGSYRFAGGVYRRLAGRLIRELLYEEVAENGRRRSFPTADYATVNADPRI